MTVLESATLPWAAERPDVDELFRRPAWMAGAACRGHPVGLFFPGKGDEQGPVKAVCESCPVLVECLAYALERPELRGVWGATGERERMRMRRARFRRP
jgi:WhiB family redox-sensing transcriptional regulator